MSWRSTAGAANPGPRPPWPEGNQIPIAHGKALLVQGSEHGGQLALTMSLDQINRQTRLVYWMAAIAMFVLLAITFGQVSVLQRTIIRPIAGLAEAAERVRADREYRFMLDATGTDEVARLADSFEAMVVAVRERENELRRLTLLQRTILDNAAYAIISTTSTGTVSSVNPAAERLLGYSAAEIVAKETPLLWHDVEEIQRRAQQLSRELGEPVTSDFSVFTTLARRKLRDENEWTFVRKDGTRVPVLLSVTALRDEQGEVGGFVGFISDLTERKRAEEALRASQALYHSFVEQLPNGVFRIDRQGRYVMVNAQLCRSKNLSADELVGRTPLEVVRRQQEAGGKDEAFIKHAEQSEAIDDLIMRTGKVVEKEEEYPDGQGRTRCVDVIRMPVYDATGEVIGSQGIEFDITERKQMETQHLRAQRMEVIGTLASGIAHDLNNILLPILLASDLLRQKLEKAEDVEYIAMIEGSAWRGASIIRQLLLFGRGAEGPRTRTDPLSLLREVAKIVRETFPRNIEIVDASALDLLVGAVRFHSDAPGADESLRERPGRDAERGNPDPGSAERRPRRRCRNPRSECEGGLATWKCPWPIPAMGLGRRFSAESSTRSTRRKSSARAPGSGCRPCWRLSRTRRLRPRPDRVGKGSIFRVFIPAAEEGAVALPQTSEVPPPKGNRELLLVVDDETSISLCSAVLWRGRTIAW